MARPFKYTTQIPARRTARECVDLLADAGAQHVAISYAAKVPIGLSFRYRDRDFAMPVRPDGMRKVLADADFGPRYRSRPSDLAQLRSAEHAADVAWRVTQDWLEANLALVAARMSSLDEAMLPYLVIAPGRTLWDEIAERGALPAISQ
jgi:hypothetical protein